MANFFSSLVAVSHPLAAAMVALLILYAQRAFAVLIGGLLNGF
jgi:hypothetical protein